MMKISPGIGISKIRIGMSQAKLIQIYGEPDKIVNVDVCDEIRFVYNEMMVTACFDVENKDKLYYIECTNTEASLWGQHIIGIHKEILIKILKEKNVPRVECQDYEAFEVVYCEDIAMQFVIEFNIVKKYP